MQQTKSDRQFIFAELLQLLRNAGCAEASARSFLGQMMKLHGESQVALVGKRAIDRKPMEPRAWLRAALERANVIEMPGRHVSHPRFARRSDRPLPGYFAGLGKSMP